MGEIVGKYLQRKKKERGFSDKAIADWLNLTVSAVEKMYYNDDISANRIAKLSALFGENLVEDYYGGQEPLKSMRQQVIDEWMEKIDALKSTISAQKASIAQLKDHIKTQNGYISLLEKDARRLEAERKAKK